jgi:YggT family protein
MSWVPGARESSVGRWLAKIVEPYLEFFRRFIPPIGIFDLSSIVALIVFNFFQNGLIALFNQFIVPLLY